MGSDRWVPGGSCLWRVRWLPARVVRSPVAGPLRRPWGWALCGGVGCSFCGPFGVGVVCGRGGWLLLGGVFRPVRCAGGCGVARSRGCVSFLVLSRSPLALSLGLACLSWVRAWAVAGVAVAVPWASGAASSGLSLLFGASAGPAAVGWGGSSAAGGSSRVRGLAGFLLSAAFCASAALLAAGGGGGPPGVAPGAFFVVVSSAVGWGGRRGSVSALGLWPGFLCVSCWWGVSGSGVFVSVRWVAGASGAAVGGFLLGRLRSWARFWRGLVAGGFLLGFVGWFCVVCGWGGGFGV